MKRLLCYFLILLASVWLGIIIHSHPGYVLLAYKNWSVETTLWLAIFVLLILFLLLHWLLSLNTRAFIFFQQFYQWIKGRKQRKMIQGLYELIEGKWQRAEKRLISATKHPDLAAINYLIAAYAANKQHAITKRDQYLIRSQKFLPPKNRAPLIMQAELLIANHQFEEALAIIERLHQKNSRNQKILQMLYSVYLELCEWGKLQKILPKLRRRAVLSPNAYQNLEQVVYSKLLLTNIKNHQAPKFWESLSRPVKRNNEIILTYVDYLLSANNHSLAENLIKKALHRNWDDRLVERYASIKGTNVFKQLKRAEIWLKKHPQNAALFLCLGRLCKQQHLWGQARFYLEKSLKIAPSAKIYYELGDLMEIQHQTAQALQYYKEACLLQPHAFEQ